MAIGLTLLLLAHLLLAVGFLLHLLKRRFDPWAMAFWTVWIIFIPVLGSLTYALLSEDRITRRAERRLGGRSAPAPLAQINHQKANLDVIDTQWRSVAEVADSIVRTRVTLGNRITVIDDSEEIYEAWKGAIASADHHVHMLFFRFWSDDTGRPFRDLLMEKAQQGVQCRVLLDTVGSYERTRDFWTSLIDAGARVAFFMPIAAFRRRWSIHLRNHRKLIVVDGRTGFMGSQNIDDNSHGHNPRYGKWADVCLRVEGPCVGDLQRVFVEDWAFATDEVIEANGYFPENPGIGTTPIQIISTGPDQKQRVVERVLLEAFLQAKDSITIATPYFIPSDIFLVGLMRARLRNVRVRIVVPTITDMPIVLHAGRSFYSQLLDEGIEICEFKDGMLHSKLVVVDESWAMTGSANMDLRSFRMNFEISALIYDREVVYTLQKILDGYCDRAKIVTRKDVEGQSLGRKLLEGAARLFAPQL